MIVGTKLLQPPHNATYLHILIISATLHLYSYNQAWQPSPQGLRVFQLSGNDLRYIPRS